MSVSRRRPSECFVPSAGYSQGSSATPSAPVTREPMAHYPLFWGGRYGATRASLMSQRGSWAPPLRGLHTEYYAEAGGADPGVGVDHTRHWRGNLCPRGRKRPAVGGRCPRVRVRPRWHWGVRRRPPQGVVGTPIKRGRRVAAPPMGTYLALSTNRTPTGSVFRAAWEDARVGAHARLVASGVGMVLALLSDGARGRHRDRPDGHRGGALANAVNRERRGRRARFVEGHVAFAV